MNNLLIDLSDEQVKDIKICLVFVSGFNGIFVLIIMFEDKEKGAETVGISLDSFQSFCCTEIQIPFPFFFLIQLLLVCFYCIAEEFNHCQFQMWQNLICFSFTIDRLTSWCFPHPLVKFFSGAKNASKIRRQDSQPAIVSF